MTANLSQYPVVCQIKKMITSYLLIHSLNKLMYLNLENKVLK